MPIEARNEGVEPTWEYKPPAKFTSVHDTKDLDFEFGEFDWDEVKKEEGVELWLVRVPESVSLSSFKYLRRHEARPTRPTRVGTSSFPVTRSCVLALLPEVRTTTQCTARTYCGSA